MKNPAAIALGSIKTARKAASSAVNGRKGGRPAGLYVARVFGSNGSPAWASSTIDGIYVQLYACGQVDNGDGYLLYRDGPHAGRPVLFRGRAAATQAACSCHWNNQRFGAGVALGGVRADGVELVGATAETKWTSCQDF